MVIIGNGVRSTYSYFIGKHEITYTFCVVRVQSALNQVKENESNYVR